MGQPRFLSVCLNPVLQKTLLLEKLQGGAVNRLRQHHFDASGKGLNVTRVLSQLGQPVVHLTQLGGRFREQFLALAANDGLRVRWCESGAEIRFCYTILEDQGSVTTEIVEEAAPVAEGTEAALEIAFHELLVDANWLVFSGSKAAGFSSSVFPRWAAAAKAAGKGLVLDVRGSDLRDSLVASPDVIKPNYDEFVATFFPGREPPPSEVRAAMDDIASHHGCAVVLTRGSESTLVATGTERFEVAVERVTPLNTTGCGDASTAGMVAVLGQGGTLREAVAAGHRCGAQNAQLVRPGTIDAAFTEPSLESGLGEK